MLLKPDIASCIFYIRNADSIFPIDIEISQRSRLDKRQRLRPEFLREYEKRLNPDTFQDTQGRNQIEQNDFELTEANKELTAKNLVNLVNSLDNMQYLPMDSLGVLRIFHEYGVNMRYLGRVIEKCKLPHVRDFLIAEMVARTIRKILDKFTSHLIYKGGQVSDVFKGEGLSKEELEEIRVSMMEDFNDELKNITLKVLNLSMGSSDKGYTFWQTLVKPQVFADFKYMFAPKFSLEDLPAGALVNACLYHLNLECEDKMYQVGKSPAPFLKSNIFGFKAKVFTIGLRKHKVGEILNLLELERERKNYDIALSYAKLKLESERLLGRMHEEIDCRAEIADLLMLLGDYPGAIEECKSSIKQLPWYSAL